MNRIVVFAFVLASSSLLGQVDSLSSIKIDSVLSLLNKEVIPYVQGASNEEVSQLKTDLNQCKEVSENTQNELDEAKVKLEKQQGALSNCEAQIKQVESDVERLESSLKELQLAVDKQIESLSSQSYRIESGILDGLINNIASLQKSGLEVKNKGRVNEFKLKKDALSQAYEILHVKLTSLSEIAKVQSLLSEAFSSGYSFNMLDQEKSRVSALLNDYADRICELNDVFQVVCVDMKMFSDEESKEILIESINILSFYEYGYLVSMIKKCYDNPKVHPMSHLKSDC